MSLKSINHLFFDKETRCISSEIGAEILNVIYLNVPPQSVKHTT
jgi:hypothetical protein